MCGTWGTLAFKTDKAIKMQKDAIAMTPEVTEDNELLVSNLYANLGGMYRVISRNDNSNGQQRVFCK